MPPGEFARARVSEFIYVFTMDTADKLYQAGRVEEAIKVLK